ncbi:MAG: hypothetical protein ACL7BU_04005 [Candidatus Phlomobacter fragariae]
MWMSCFIGGVGLETLIAAYQLGALCFIIGAMVILATKADYISLLSAKAIDQAGFWYTWFIVICNDSSSIKS